MKGHKKPWVPLSCRLPNGPRRWDNLVAEYTAMLQAQTDEDLITWDPEGRDHETQDW